MQRMSIMKNDNFGDRMKEYEKRLNNKLMPLLPIYIRLDGKNFSKFTKGLEKPYDKRMVDIMEKVTIALVKEFNADVGYTQSDEISLIWENNNVGSEMLFDGKTFKWISIISSFTSVVFNNLVREYLPEKSDKLPVFDCRIVQFPNIIECLNMLYWRIKDAQKNSISGAAQTVYSHKELMNKSSKEKQEMLFQKGINWNDYPSFFKQGIFVGKRDEQVDPSLLMDIPERYRPTQPVIRRVVKTIEMPIYSTVSNKYDVFFKQHTPVLEGDYNYQVLMEDI